MCFFGTPTPAAPVAPPIPQQAQVPDQSGVNSDAAAMLADRYRSGASTILTSSQGVLNSAPTAKKTLLGQ